MNKVSWLDRRTAAPGPFLALCLNEPQFRRACAHIKMEPPPFILNEWSNATTHYFESRYGLTVIVCMRDWLARNPVEVAGLLVHEAVHVWQEYAARIGEHSPGKEQEAYAIQAFSQELMQSFAEQTKELAL